MIKIIRKNKLYELKLTYLQKLYNALMSGEAYTFSNNERNKF